MASETNELTFVRCPTCRSLVPASASKCRICNATLDAGSKSAAADASSPPSGRVRQKTVSAGAEEVRNIAAASSPPPGPVQNSGPVATQAVAKAPVPPAPVSSANDETFDPLGAFLQDLDSNDHKTTQAGATNISQADSAPLDLFADDDGGDESDSDDDDDDLDDFDLDIFDDPSFDDPIDVQPKYSESSQADKVVLEPTEPLMDRDEQDSEVQVQPEPPQPAPAAPRPAPPRQNTGAARRDREPPRGEIASAPETRKPQNRDPQPLTVEEPRASKTATPARAGQSQIRPRIGGMPNRAEPKPPVKVTERTSEVPKMPSTMQRVAEDRGTIDSREKPVRAAPVQQPVQSKTQPVAATGRNKVDVDSPRQQARPVPERQAQITQSEGPRPSKMKAGRLFGWLVSYEHPDGRAIELRAGRFFVTGTSIRATDLILEDQSISTPHALMSITENGLQLQDLMSERGTFVRCQGEAQYTREEGVVELQHGDWVRFGDVEFLVTVVPA